MTTEYRFAVNVTPKPGILDPQGRAVEGSLGHLGIEGVSGIRVGRRVELNVVAADAASAAATVERLAAELLSNPLIEAYAVERLQATSSDSTRTAAAVGAPVGADAGTGTPAGAGAGVESDGR